MEFKINKNFFKNQSLLITGGTGSFGKAFLNYLLLNKFPLKKIVIFSRDEFKQFEMRKKFNDKYSNLRFFLGDIRDKERLNSALREVDIVVHAAALKQVSTAEYNPIEFIKTNVIGTQNIIEASLFSKVKNIVALSTDKASSPINLYGATKLCSDKLFISANNIKGTRDIKFSIVRYGNVMGSRGSVLNNFLDQKINGELLITDNEMTRFHISLENSIAMVIYAITNAKGGEIFVPKLPSFYVRDLAKAICPNCKIKIIGIRPGEKLHEEMISVYDSLQTFDLQKYYVIASNSLIKSYSQMNFKLVKKNFCYDSKNNIDFLNIKDLHKITQKIFES
jgi:UDP-N-acetylglucosamine 4,6-dehydratase (inverting)